MIPGLELLADVRDRLGDEARRPRPSCSISCGALADDHPCPHGSRARSISPKTSSTERSACRRHERSRSRGSARRPARSARGRWRAGARSPPACRRCGPPRCARPSMRSVRASRRRDRRRRRRRAGGRSRRASRRAPPPGRGCAGTRRARTPPRRRRCASRSRISCDRQLVGDELAARLGSARPARPSSVRSSRSRTEHVAGGRAGCRERRRRSASPACPSRTLGPENEDGSAGAPI